MATINVSHELDVLKKYDCIIENSLGADSVYIRTKETLAALMESGDLSSKEKAEIVSNVLNNLNNSLTSSSLSVALQWASKEKELELEKLKLAKELDILDEDLAIRKAQLDKLYWDSVATQANTIRMYGTPVVLDGVVQTLADEGKILSDTHLVDQQKENLTKELDLLDSRIKESSANIHRTVADTVVNHGAWSYTINDNGLPTAPVRTEPSSVVPLSDVQRVIASEQAKGYSYNAWANAVTASAGMLGTAIASDGAIPNVEQLVTDFRNTLLQLQTVTGPTIPTTP